MSQGKKGLSPLAWVAIGCVGLLVMGGIAMSLGVWFVGKKAKGLIEDFEERPVEMGAKAIALANPELEFVSANEEGRTVVMRNEKTGEEMTFNFDDIENGNFSFDTGEGEVSVSAADAAGGGGLTITQNGKTKATIGGGGGAEELPDWVPVYPGADVKVGFSSTGDQGSAGIFEMSSTDTADKMLDFLEAQLEEAGYKITRQRVSVGDSGPQGIVTGTYENGKRTVNATASLDGDNTKVAVQYSSRN
ncbi:MAG: hypothetical protein K0U98_03055 [Deltaproteobacteria bacterium]|nr:hypothetical protein [Deltaproteobacteria bacterium]